jgi:hypothetical protein
VLSEIWNLDMVGTIWRFSKKGNEGSGSYVMRRFEMPSSSSCWSGGWKGSQQVKVYWGFSWGRDVEKTHNSEVVLHVIRTLDHSRWYWRKQLWGSWGVVYCQDGYFTAWTLRGVMRNFLISIEGLLVDSWTII